MAIASDPAAMTEPTPARAEGGFWTRLDALISWLGEGLNPILVKETRQALKSRQFTLWFVLLLVACWITTVGGVALVGPSIYYVSAGGYLLRVYYAVLLLPLTVVIPFNAFRSLTAEQEENTRDLLEVSTLTPWQVVNGKLGSAVLQMLMYLSALAPCIAFTYLLRGVDLLTIGLLLLYAVLASIGLSMIGLLLAATNKQRRGQNFLAVVFAGGLFFAFSTIFAMSMAAMELDPGERSSPAFFWIHLGLLSLYATTFGIVYVATAGLCTFSSANRSTPLRVALVIQQAVFIAWCAGMIATSPAVGDGLLAIVFTASIYWFVAGAVLTSEPAELSQRVRRRLPQSLVGRALFSWFCPGPASGYIFAITNLGLVLLLWAGSIIWCRVTGSMPLASALFIAAVCWAYIVTFLGLGLLAITALRKVATLTLLGGFLVQVLLVLAASGVPLLVQVLSNRVRLGDATLYETTSPVLTVMRLTDGQLDATEEYLVAGVVFSAAASVLLVCLRLAGREAGLRRVAKPQRVIEDDLSMAPAAQPVPTNPWGDLAVRTARTEEREG
ncbi:hypothetical protein [Botrimarina hoheduenensis]|uniref:ABC-2 family transporter protein n=1 Tax=Botrimarina hoheduenensis TaxID=2528000 RepID=A0A5C5WDT6_9BACT|nr:hypothetical protein [Botrimarina hoheduenensis]TWT48864.1 hypothetical protein Pla111_06400 [Botrimarina hoheduenensis]